MMVFTGKKDKIQSTKKAMVLHQKFNHSSS